MAKIGTELFWDVNFSDAQINISMLWPITDKLVILYNYVKKDKIFLLKSAIETSQL